MRVFKSLLAVPVVVSLTVAPAFAGQRGNSGAHGNAGSHGPSTHGPSSHPTTPASAGPKTTKGPSTHATGASTHTTHGPASDASAKNTSHGPKKGTTTPTTTATATTFTSTDVGQKLTKNTALQSKLATKLTALGYPGTVFEAAYGFKNLGQFVAATNVSQNLGIPFELLKLQMTGFSVDANGNILEANVGSDGKTTLVDPSAVTNPAPLKSLGQAIQTLRPNADATAAAEKATAEAEAETEQTSRTSVTVPKTTSTKSRKRS